MIIIWVVTAENVAKNFKLLEKNKINLLLNLKKKLLKAQKQNKFKEEIINFKIKSKKAEIILIKMNIQEKV